MTAEECVQAIADAMPQDFRMNPMDGSLTVDAESMYVSIKKIYGILNEYKNSDD